MKTWMFARSFAVTGQVLRQPMIKNKHDQVEVFKTVQELLPLSYSKSRLPWDSTCLACVISNNQQYDGCCS